MIVFSLVLIGFIALLFRHLAVNTVWNDEGLSYFVAIDGVQREQADG